MYMKLLRMTSDERKVGKTRVMIRELSGVTLKEDTSILTPVFRINNVEEMDLLYTNYVWVKELSRFYFVRDIKLCKGGIIELYCEVDVLETYKSNIRDIKTMVDRQENKNNPYIADNEVPMRVERQQSKITVGTVGSTLSYVLTVVGGV